MTDDPDRDLIERWQRGGAEREIAFREIYGRYWKRVAALLKHRGHLPERVKELTQETFLRVFKGLETFRGETLLAWWILKIATRAHISEVRQLHMLKRLVKMVSLNGPLFPEVMNLRADTVDPEVETLSRERVEALHQALTKLPPKMRQCVELRVLHGLSNEEIACKLDIPSPETVRAHLHEARKRLRKLLKRHFAKPGF